CSEFGGIRAGGGFDDLAAFGVGGGPIHCASDGGDYWAAGDCVFQLSADDCGLSDGGGSYTVARGNLGSGAGVLAGAALMIDYLLNVAVGISAGIGALVSA